jgi:hypothetical protein
MGTPSKEPRVVETHNGLKSCISAKKAKKMDAEVPGSARKNVNFGSTDVREFHHAAHIEDGTEEAGQSLTMSLSSAKKDENDSFLSGGNKTPSPSSVKSLSPENNAASPAEQALDVDMDVSQGLCRFHTSVANSMALHLSLSLSFVFVSCLCVFVFVFNVFVFVFDFTP